MTEKQLQSGNLLKSRIGDYNKAKMALQTPVSMTIDTGRYAIEITNLSSSQGIQVRDLHSDGPVVAVHISPDLPEEVDRLLTYVKESILFRTNDLRDEFDKL